MLPDEVREAVETLRPEDGRPRSMARRQTEAWATIKAHLLAREAEVANLRAKTACTLGVGRGDGNLFVHGDFDSIKAAQAFIFWAEKAEMLLRSCNAACNRVIDQDGGILGGIDFNALGASITAHLSENSRG